MVLESQKTKRKNRQEGHPAFARGIVGHLDGHGDDGKEDLFQEEKIIKRVKDKLGAFREIYYICL